MECFFFFISCWVLTSISPIQMRRLGLKGEILNTYTRTGVGEQETADTIQRRRAEPAALTQNSVRLWKRWPPRQTRHAARNRRSSRVDADTPTWLRVPSQVLLTVY